MHLQKQPGNYDDDGAYGVVFFVGDRAIKVFRRRTAELERHVRDVFESEVGAYKRALESPELRPLVGHFIGATTCESIRDAAGNDISSEFHLDCAYEMVRVDAPFIKVGTLPSDAALVDLRRALSEVGIFHLSDFSVAYDADGAIMHIIDFAVREYEVQHPEM